MITNHKLKIDKDFQAKIKKEKPECFKKHHHELREAGVLAGDKIILQFEVGNHYKQLKKGEYI